MYRVILFLFILTGFQSLHAQVEENLLAYYSFDNCNSNNSLTGFNGRDTGNIQCVCGYRGQAYKFSGNEAVKLGDDNSGMGDVVTASEFTLSMALLTSKSQGLMTVFSIRKDCGEAGYELLYNPSAGQFIFSVNNGTTVEDVIFADDSKACWQYIVITRMLNKFSFFINGQVKNIYTFTNNPNIRNGGVPILGAGACNPLSKSFVGLIDEVKIYSRLISIEKAELLSGAKINKLSDNFQVVFPNRPYPVEFITSCPGIVNWSPSTGVDDPSSTKVNISTDVTTRYSASVSYEGCSQSDTILIKVQDPNAINCDNMLLPNAFTPNGDNLNDTYGISTVILADEGCLFEIFDLNGNRVFHTTSSTGRWDGTYQGNPAPPGVYMYKLRYTCGGEKFSKAGSVNLIR